TSDATNSLSRHRRDLGHPFWRALLQNILEKLEGWFARNVVDLVFALQSEILNRGIIPWLWNIFSCVPNINFAVAIAHKISVRTYKVRGIAIPLEELFVVKSFPHQLMAQ